MELKQRIVRTWDGKYVRLRKADDGNFFEECEDQSQFVKATVQAWRDVMGDELEDTEYPTGYACEIVDIINESECGVKLPRVRYIEG